jgi:PST family polysaccharide transporter
MRRITQRAELYRGWLHSRPNLTKAVNNASYLFADRALRLGVGVFVGVWMARYLGPHDFGVYSFALACVFLFNPLTTLGLDAIVVRDLVRDPAERADTLGTCWFLRLLGSALAVVICNGVMIILRPEDLMTRSLVAISSLGSLFQTIETTDLWFQSQLQARRSVTARWFALATASGLRIGLILGEAPVIAFAVAGVVELLVSAAALGVAYVTSGQSISTWRFRWHKAQTLLTASWPLAVSSMAIIAYMKIDQVMLGEMLGPTAVGTYAAATRISELWYFIPMVIVASVFPSLIEARGRDEALYRRRMQQLFDGMVVLALVTATPIALLAPRIVETLYGSDYASAGGVLAVHAWASVFVFLGVAQTPWDAVEGLTRVAMVRTLVGVAIKIGLNLVLIRSFGLQGAAVASLASYACAAWLANLLNRKTWCIFDHQSRALFVLRHGFGAIARLREAVQPEPGRPSG